MYSLVCRKDVPTRPVLGNKKTHVQTDIKCIMCVCMYCVLNSVDWVCICIVFSIVCFCLSFIVHIPVIECMCICIND